MPLVKIKAEFPLPSIMQNLMFKYMLDWWFGLKILLFVPTFD